MLSRAAEALYWMSRHIERAEDIARLLGVTYEVLLETGAADDAEGWWPLLRTLGHEEAFRACCANADTASVAEFLLWNQANPTAVVACVQHARENARAAREQISTEMWEHLNRGYFMTKDADRGAVLRSLHSFLDGIRDLSQAFQGITTATMMHGEPYEFIQLGTYIERASETVYALLMKHAAMRNLKEGSPASYRHLFALLKSCSAFEPYRRTHASQLMVWRVTQYVLLSREFPRAVAFCLNRCLQAVDSIAAGEGRGSDGRTGLRFSSSPAAAPQRAFGRLCSELEYLDIHEVLGDGFPAFLHGVIRRINAAGEEVGRTFFNTHVVVPETFPPAQQQQQQQACAGYWGWKPREVHAASD